MSAFDRCDCRRAILEANGLSPGPECDDVDDATFGEGCPLPKLSALPRFMDAAKDPAYNFCNCAEGERDENALLRIDDLYVQDLDRDVDDEPDDLYAALLLDMPNEDASDANLRVAYRTLLNPDAPLRRVESETESLVPNADKLEKPDPALRQIYISNPDFDNVDLCNDSGAGSLAEGWHTLTIIVTDRPWLTVTAGDDMDSEAPPIIKHGVPDVANSATWTTRQYTFHCEDPEDGGCVCDPVL
jgi:hypothetical protein